jgi:hypothetical protein
VSGFIILAGSSQVELSGEADGSSSASGGLTVTVPLSAVAAGTSTVIGDLTSTPFQDLSRILMLVHPTFQAELNTVTNQQTFTFVKKTVKGLYFVDIYSVVGTTLACQVKTGDGANATSFVDVSVRTSSNNPFTVTVLDGEPLAGNGTAACAVRSSITGAFTVSVVGTGTVFVEMTPKEGVMMSVVLVF